MLFEDILRQLQEENPSLTAAELQADLDWLREHGYAKRVPEVWDEEIGAYVTEH